MVQTAEKKKPKVIRTKWSEYWLEDGILRVKVLPVHMTIDEAIEGNRLIEEHFVTAGTKVLIFCDYTDIKSQTRECRQYYAGKETADRLIACAILTGSRFGKVIGNFYMGLNKLTIPTRLFTDEAEGLKWLKEQE